MWAEWMKERDMSRGGEWMRIGWLNVFAVSHIPQLNRSQRNIQLSIHFILLLHPFFECLSPENLMSSFNWSRFFWIMNIDLVYLDKPPHDDFSQINQFPVLSRPCGVSFVLNPVLHWITQKTSPEPSKRKPEWKASKAMMMSPSLASRFSPGKSEAGSEPCGEKECWRSLASNWVQS